MGLDGIEILMEVEDEFGIALNDAEVSQVRCVGELIDCVHRKSPQCPPHICHSAHMFYRLRSHLVSLLDISRTDVRPTSSFTAIIPAPHRQHVWASFRDIGFPLPGLVRPRFVIHLSMFFIVSLGVSATLLTHPTFGFAGAALLGLLCVPIGALLAAWLTSKYATVIPATCDTVRAAVHLTSRAINLSRSEVAERTRLIIAEQMNIPLHSVTEDKTWDDLGVNG